MYPSFVACLDEELDVGIHKRDRHCYCGAVRQDKVDVLAELLDHAKDVIPSTAIQARTVVTQLKDDLQMSAKSSSHGQAYLPLPFQRQLRWFR